MRRHSKKIIISVICLFALGIIFGWFSNIRYSFDKKFGDPHTIIFGVGVGVRYIEDNVGGYEEEISMDDTYIADINYGKYLDEDNMSPNEIELYLYGKFINSNDPLIVVLNDKVIYNGNPSREMTNFYENIYIEKRFVIKLKGIRKGRTNKLVLSTGNYNHSYTINTTFK